jgi:hypothetical protein
MKNFAKSLNNLAGGDDTIFAIIDDRFDVWMQEVKDPETGQVIQSKVSKNLILIPPYFYWEQTQGLPKLESFKKDLAGIAKHYELDLALLCHLKFLDRVH